MIIIKYYILILSLLILCTFNHSQLLLNFLSVCSCEAKYKLQLIFNFIFNRKEASLRQEAVELLRRLEAAEARSEELAQSVSGSTRPILRQLEMLQAASSTQQATWEKQERALSDTIGN